MGVKHGANKGKAKQLRWHQLLLLRVCSLLMALWTRTLRYRWGADVQELIERRTRFDRHPLAQPPVCGTGIFPSSVSRAAHGGSDQRQW